MARIHHVSISLAGVSHVVEAFECDWVGKQITWCRWSHSIKAQWPEVCSFVMIGEEEDADVDVGVACDCRIYWERMTGWGASCDDDGEL